MFISVITISFISGWLVGWLVSGFDAWGWLFVLIWKEWMTSLWEQKQFRARINWALCNILISKSTLQLWLPPLAFYSFLSLSFCSFSDETSSPIMPIRPAHFWGEHIFLKNSLTSRPFVFKGFHTGIQMRVNHFWYCYHCQVATHQK